MLHSSRLTRQSIGSITPNPQLPVLLTPQLSDLQCSLWISTWSNDLIPRQAVTYNNSNGFQSHEHLLLKCPTCKLSRFLHTIVAVWATMTLDVCSYLPLSLPFDIPPFSFRSNNLTYHPFRTELHLHLPTFSTAMRTNMPAHYSSFRAMSGAARAVDSVLLFTVPRSGSKRCRW